VRARSARLILPLVACLALVACKRETISCSSGPGLAVVELVETAPIDTDFDHPELRETHEVWLEMIAGARHTIELEHFYASNAEGSRLERVIEALEAAADRGVKVLFTSDKGFYERQYADTLDRLDAHHNIEVDLLDFGALTGGIQHAKCMLVDGDDLYVGSANFDYRALEHIQELGLRIQSSEVGAWVQAVLAYDRAIARGETPETAEPGQRPSIKAVFENAERDAGFTLSAAFSPTGQLPNPGAYDLPELVASIHRATKSIRLQLLSYKPVDRQGEWWPELDDALRAAAERGVDVKLIVADWSDKPGSIEPLASLAALPHCAVAFVSVPEHESGPIPFARVVHAKYMVVDDDFAWLGTSNWQRGYFTKSRNLGFFCAGAEPAHRLAAFFDDNWSSDHARRVTPAQSADRPAGH
jgi:phosphatidylserine/phosphatidylglycerophosphate/cardiolipin synthase-like enzyme